MDPFFERKNEVRGLLYCGERLWLMMSTVYEYRKKKVPKGLNVRGCSYTETFLTILATTPYHIYSTHWVRPWTSKATILPSIWLPIHPLITQ